MEISLGFLVVLVLVLFPGLIFRRLYFYGEFSKEFKAGNSLVGLLAISTIPGLTILITTYLTYHNLFVEIDLDQIIDKLKEFNDPSSRNSNSNDQNLNKILGSKVAPFLGYLYLVSFLLGSSMGRLVRITRLDTKFKLLRFKNHWFYLLNGQIFDLKRHKHLKRKNKKVILTKADILIDTNTDTQLYSGVVVDYEISESDCNVLKHIVLNDPKRYPLKDGKRSPVPIPGELLVVDCKEMKTINFTYVFEDTKDILKSNTPYYIEVVNGLLILLLIPIFIFQSDGLELDFYKSYFEMTWYAKLTAYFLVLQSISILNPFVRISDKYKWVDLKSLLFKIVYIVVLIILLWLFNF